MKQPEAKREYDHAHGDTAVTCKRRKDKDKQKIGRAHV